MPELAQIFVEFVALTPPSLLLFFAMVAIVILTSVSNPGRCSISLHNFKFYTKSNNFHVRQQRAVNLNVKSKVPQLDIKPSLKKGSAVGHKAIAKNFNIEEGRFLFHFLYILVVPSCILLRSSCCFENGRSGASKIDLKS